MNDRPMLSVSGLHGYYGKSHILQGIEFEVGDGELVALLGRNGVGKTTTMRAIAGALRNVKGEIRLDGKMIQGKPSHVIARLGLSLVPEDRGIFGSLSVEENLRLARRGGARRSLEDIWTMFPSLANRRRTPGGKLSGGEQQMLSIGRALLTDPRLLLLDEPTEGLAPVIVDRLVELLLDLKKSGLSILLVEQSLEVCTRLADRFLVLDGGRIVWQGDRAQLDASEDVVARHLTLEHA
jgi:branched-chain amino acid transport system ATP-binding protein